MKFFNKNDEETINYCVILKEYNCDIILGYRLIVLYTVKKCHLDQFNEKLNDQQLCRIFESERILGRTEKPDIEPVGHIKWHRNKTHDRTQINKKYVLKS